MFVAIVRAWGQFGVEPSGEKLIASGAYWAAMGVNLLINPIELFGVDRCMFASNFPTDKPFSTMRAVWQAFFSITKGFSESERDKLFAANAIRHYRLGL